MHPHRTSAQVKYAKITDTRPGIATPFMQPTAMKNQERIGTTKANLKFTPTGKNLVGGTQWTIVPQGLAQPLIVAKQEQQALAKGLAREATIAAAQAKGMPIVAKKQAAKAEVAEDVIAEAQADAGLGGYGNYYGAYGTSW